jgi:NadR type nicotinamide-nucleotide adenylyltransferase
VKKTRRIVVTGPESTGKTVLATGLAARLDAPVVFEAARLYAEARAREGRTLTISDAEPVAKLAIDQEQRALAAAPPLVVLDTDLISTVVYVRHYYGSCPAWIETEARERRAELYLLCDIDLPWIADGVRDRPDDRRELYGLFWNTLVEFGCTVVPIAGTGALRLDAALAAVDDCLFGLKKAPD